MSILNFEWLAVFQYLDQDVSRLGSRVIIVSIDIDHESLSEGTWPRVVKGGGGGCLKDSWGLL